jgi:tetratricopeptide (TPR) repeat protein
MNRLFELLKRVQGWRAKVQSAGSSGEKSENPQESGTSLSTPNKPATKIMPYAASGLMLLAAISSWYLYQYNQYTTKQPDSTQSPASPPISASQPVAASSVAETIATLPPSASGTNSSSKWTHPAANRQPKHRRPAQPASAPRADALTVAYQSLSEGNLEQAEQSYLAVLASQPHEKDALLGLAVIAQRRMQAERATALFRQVLREDLGNTTAAAGLVSLSALADPVAAESQLRELLSIKPDAAELHYALGGVLARQQRWSEAQPAFFRAYSLAPEKALYAYNLAVSLDHLRQTAAARPYYEKAIQLAQAGDTTINRDLVERRIKELDSSRK